jgi:NADPH2:quinone reductase
VCSTFPVKAGDTVLVHAAAGGTGRLIVQVAKLKGATVIGTAGSESKVLQAKEIGCDHVINYTQQDFLVEVKRLTNNVGVNCVYDGVGAQTYDKSMQCLNKLGYLVLFGNASGPVPPIVTQTQTQRDTRQTPPTLDTHMSVPSGVVCLFRVHWS